MLGKVALVIGAGAGAAAAYVLRTSQGRTRVAQLVPGGGAGSGSSALPGGQLLRRRSHPTGEAVPEFVDRRPQGDEGAPAEASGMHLLPDARPVEIARAVAEEQEPR